MASCPKCGKPKLKKTPEGSRWCKRCGSAPSCKHLDRSGKNTA